MIPQSATYTGTLPKGIVVINNIHKRGRRLGYDVFEKVRKVIPLDIAGMGSQEIGGIGEIPHEELLEYIGQYLFFFNPIRYTSLGLSILEAMMLGLPVIGLATTELVTVVKNGFNGFVDTNVDVLIEKMNRLISDPELAQRLSIGARISASERFSINRFVRDWEELLHILVAGKSRHIIPDFKRIPGGAVL